MLSHAPRAFSAALCLAAFAALAVAPQARAHGDGSYPRTFNLHWQNRINAFYDSRYDVLVTSTRVQNDQLDSLRAFNPTIQRVVSLSWYIQYYAGPSGYPHPFGPFDANHPIYGWDRKYWDLMENNDWWLYGVDSSGTQWKAGLWWETWTGNFSTACPPNAQGQRLCDVFADYLVDNLLSQRHAEGVYFDQCWDDPGHANWRMWDACEHGTDCSDPSVPRTPETEFEVGFDCDVDGVADHPDSLAAWWSGGIKIVMARLRQRLGPDYLLLGNGPHHYADMNGAMHERFPRLHGRVDPAPNPAGYKWNDSMFSPRFGYLGLWESYFQTPRVNMIDTEHPEASVFNALVTPSREAFKRWTLGSTLLGDGYYTAHGVGYVNMWWEPEYDLRLGWPLGPAYGDTLQGIGVWRRDFTHGEVWVNSTGFGVSETASHPAIPPRDAVIRETSSGPIHQPAGGSATLLAMESPWPNPAVGPTSLRFRADPGTSARLLVFDVAGRLVREIWSGVGTGAFQVAVWDGRHDRGYDAAPGVYLAVLLAGDESVQARMVRVR